MGTRKKDLPPLRRFALVLAGVLLMTSLAACTPQSEAEKKNTVPLSYTYAEENTLSPSADAPEGMYTVASSAGMQLYLDPVSTRFCLRDQAGALWYSGVTEDEADEDELAYGEYRRALTSLLTVKCCDLKGEGAKEYASTRHSVRDETFTVKYVFEKGQQIGFRVDFTFADLSLTVPLLVGLRDGALFATVPMEEIRYEDPNTVLLEVGVLPHFGSASKEETGYLLVPDGCGSLITLNNGRTNAGGYEGQVYGADATFVKDRQAGDEELVMLPVFGMKRQEQAFLAVIDGCDSYANIMAESSGINTERNYIYSRFRFKELDSFPLKDLSGKEQDYTVVDTEVRSLPPISVQYYFLVGEQANYVGMADSYAAWLQKYKGMTKQSTKQGLLLELYGAVRRQQSVMGVPATVSQSLTDFSQAEEMIGTLEKEGLSGLTVRYQYATDSRLMTQVSDEVDILSKLGGEKGYAALVNSLRDSGGDCYLSVNTATAKETLFATGFVRNVMNLKAYQSQYDALTGYKDESDRYCLYTADIVREKVEALFADAGMREMTTTLAPETMGSLLYSSFNDTYYSREDTKDSFVAALATARENGLKLMLAGVNAYALPYAAVAVDVPVQSNHYSVLDTDIPFYQLVVSRFVPCVSQPINLTSNPRQQFLHCLQSGSVPQFAFVAEDPTLLQETDLEGVFAADFAKWLPDVVTYGKAYQAVQTATGGSCLVSFSVLEEGLTLSVYANGACILVNEGSEARVYEGTEIPAMDYRIISA